MDGRVIREVVIGGRPVIIKELKVIEIRNWLLGKQTVGDLIDGHLFEELALSDIPFLTDLDSGAVDDMTPSQIKSLIDQIREVNPVFFVMRERLAAIGREILAMNRGMLANELGI